MVTKKGLASKIFGENGNMQGSKRVPMKAVKEYGTGLPYKKPPAMKKGKNK